jgi:hypothetical protein
MALRLAKLFRGWFSRPPRPSPRPADPRLAADAWLGALFAALGDRYQLGPDSPDGARVLRRTGRARFNPMPVWVQAAEKVVRADYEVRGDAAAGKALLDQRLGARLPALGLLQVAETLEEWAGTVLTQRYQGRYDLPQQAADAVRFVCEESEAQINLAAE